MNRDESGRPPEGEGALLGHLQSSAGVGWRTAIEACLERGGRLVELLEAARGEGAGEPVEPVELSDLDLDWLEFCAGGELEGAPPEGRGAWLERLGELLPQVAERLARRRVGSDLSLRAVADTPGDVPGYSVHERLGEGGMGAVFRATQTATGRGVALKLMHAGIRGPGVQARFDAEVQALARLEHPGIAAVLDAGVLDARASGGGRPWLAMELVPGARPLLEHASTAGLLVAARIELMMAVCAGVAHGHSRGVVHRDLKSDNVLVDEAGRPRLIDFGVARLVGEGDLPLRQTLTGDFVGTLETAAPEQVLEGGSSADSRTDVYALGLLLFHLLTGRPAFQLRGKSLPEIMEILRSRPAPRPSRVLRKLPVDLDWVVGRALDKDPRRRYADAGELAADLQRLHEGRPVLARPPSIAYRARLLLMRHVLAGAALAALLLVSAGVATRLALLEGRRGDALASVSEQLRQEAYLAQVVAADQALRAGDLGQARRSLEATDPDRRRFEWDFLAERLRSPAIDVSQRSSWYRNVGFGGGRAFVASQDREVEHDVELFDRDWGRVGRSVLDVGENLRFFALDSGGARLLAVAESGRVRVFDWVAVAGAELLELQGGAPFELEGVEQGIRAVRWDSVEDRMWIGTGAGQLGSWRLDGPRALEVVAQVEELPVQLDVAPDGSQLAAFTGPGSLHVFDVDTGAERFSEPSVAGEAFSWRRGVKYSPCGRWLALHRLDYRVEVLRVEDGTRAATFDNGTGPYQAAVWTLDGRYLLTAASNGSVLALDVELGVQEQRFALSTNLIDALECSPDGRWLLAGEYDGLARRVDLEAHLQTSRRPLEEPQGWRLSWAPDSQSLGYMTGDPALNWQGLDRIDPAWSTQLAGAAGDLVAGAGGRGWALVAGEILAFEGPTGEIAGRHGLGAGVGQGGWGSLARLSKGELVAVSAGGRLEVLDVDGLGVLRAREFDSTALNAVACSSDGRRIALGTSGAGVVLLDAATLEERGRWAPPRPAPVRGVAFGGSGGWLAVVLQDGAPVLLDGSDLTPIAQLPDLGAYVTGVDFHPHQDRLALGDRFGRAHLFEVPSGRLLLSIDAGLHLVEDLEFSPDGLRLAAASRSGLVLLHAVDDSARRELLRRTE